MDDESSNGFKNQTEAISEKQQFRKSDESISAKDTNIEVKSSSVSNSFTEKQITTINCENPSKETSLTNLYAWGCTDLILEEYRRKGISQMFEWQADCLQKIAQVSDSTFHSIPSSNPSASLHSM